MVGCCVLRAEVEDSYDVMYSAEDALLVGLKSAVGAYYGLDASRGRCLDTCSSELFDLY